MDIGSILTDPTTWIFAAATSLYWLYRQATSTFHVFSEQGIPGPKPIPLVGTAWGMWRWNIPKHDREMVKEYGKVYGTFQGTKPTLNINDTKLIRSVFVKDFDHFINRRKIEFPEMKVFRYMLSSMENQPWKDVRSAVTPTFTSGKIKRYSAQMKECADKLCQHLHSLAADKGKFDLKDEMSVVTVSVIAKCAFGMTIDNLGAKGNLFIQKAQTVFAAPENKSPLIMLLFVLPNFVMKWLGTYLLNLEHWYFFIDIMKNMVEERSKTTEKFYDFPETATESISAYTKEEDGKVVQMWTKEQVDEIVTAQSTLFLVAGFDTTANTLTASCYILARHPEIQEKIYDLIMDKIDQYGDVCHELIQDVPYVDQFMNEVLRMHPPVTQLERQCNKKVTYDGIHISEDMVVSVATYALHYSEEYYPDPETFNPDRWAPENKANLDPYAFMPFGMGPRNCVAMRFAQEEVKLVLCTLIKQFRFFPVEETPAKFEVEDGFNAIIQPLKTTLGIATRA